MLKYKTFSYTHELCDFVNEKKVRVEQIIKAEGHYILFYWEE